MSNHWLNGMRFGDRARIGVIVPASGTVLDHEWARMLPEGVLAPGARVRLDGGAADQLEAFVGAVPASAAMLSGVKPTIIALACALGTAFRGPDKEVELLQEISTAAGRPALGMARSAIEALLTLGARRVALLTPYSDSASDWLRNYLLASGFETGLSARLPVSPAAAAEMEPDEVAAAARTLLAQDSESDALWLACGNVRTLEIVEQLENTTGRAVVSSNVALLWASVRRCGLQDVVEGAGRIWSH